MINVYLLKAIFEANKQKNLLSGRIKEERFQHPVDSDVCRFVFIEYLVMKRIGRRRKVRNEKLAGRLAHK
jgi:hypothetical protein